MGDVNLQAFMRGDRWSDSLENILKGRQGEGLQVVSLTALAVDLHGEEE